MPLQPSERGGGSGSKRRIAGEQKPSIWGLTNPLTCKPSRYRQRELRRTALTSCPLSKGSRSILVFPLLSGEGFLDIYPEVVSVNQGHCLARESLTLDSLDAEFNVANDGFSTPTVLSDRTLQ